MLSFGDFIQLYVCYYQTYNERKFNYCAFLNSIKFIRNAAAHNNCILCSLKKPAGTSKFRKTKELTNVLGKIPELAEQKRDKMMKNPVIHDFVALLFVYCDILKLSDTVKSRNKRINELRKYFCDDDGRVLKNRDYFKSNGYIRESYQFVSSIIKYIDKKNHDPRHRNFL